MLEQDVAATPISEVALESDLDPASEAEWEAARLAGHRIVDAVLARHRGVRAEACWSPVPESLRRALARPAPAQGVGLEAAVAEAAALTLPHGTGNLHPRFWGWVLGAGNIPGILGQWMAAGLNSNVFAGEQVPVLMELAVLGWFRAWFGFPEGSSGLLVDGASMANLLGLAVARHRGTSGRSRSEGPEACLGLRLYASEATHNSIVKGAELLGLGSRAVRLVPTGQDGAVDLAALEAAIAGDRAAGLRPFCVVGNAGTVGIGALDPLRELRELADRHGLWFHVDGAIGALACLSPRLRPSVAGLELADSLAFDLHKWAQVPYDVGGLLVRDGRLHREAFESGAEYLGQLPGGLSRHGSHAFHAYTPLLSRADRALKVWTTFTALGADRLAAVVEKNVDQAARLGDLVDRHPELERLAPVALNIVCFRYRGAHTDPARVDAVNERILVELQESGFCMLSPYRVAGRLCLRVAISNHRTRRSDVEELVRRVVELGRAAPGDGGPGDGGPDARADRG